MLANVDKKACVERLADKWWDRQRKRSTGRQYVLQYAVQNQHSVARSAVMMLRSLWIYVDDTNHNGVPLKLVNILNMFMLLVITGSMQEQRIDKTRLKSALRW